MSVIRCVIDATGRLISNKVLPDQLVRDLSEAGYSMVVWHEKEHQGKAGKHTRTYWSRSNIFMCMTTQKQVTIDDDKIYRVDVVDREKIIVTSYGIDQNSDYVGGIYSSIDTLPEWMQGKLALLYMLDPVAPKDDVPEVGRRINHNVFWIYP